MKKQNTIILITGMHRSGTSLLGSIMQAIGVPLPGHLLAGDIYNMDGYYEREDIVKLQEDILIKMGRWWPTTYGSKEMPSGWRTTNNIRNYKKRLKEIITNEINNQDSMWAIKDPRISLLLPIWNEIANEEDINLKIAISIRNPVEVINSLLYRDKNTTGMTPERAEDLWYLHNSQVIENIIGQDSLLVEYTRWFNKEESLKQLNKLYKFCFDVNIPENIMITAQGKINFKYRRSNRDIENVRPFIKSQTLEFYKMLKDTARARPRENNDLKLIEWLGSKRKKSNDTKLKDAWFNKQYYKNQINKNWKNGLLRTHYNLIGWRKSRAPNELFSPNFYKHKAYLRDISVKGCPLDHFSKYGLDIEIEPNSLTYYKWIKENIFRTELFKSGNLEGFHPWAAAAIAINNGSQQKGMRTLERWVTTGLTYNDLEEILNSGKEYYSHGRLSRLNSGTNPPKVINVTCDICGHTNWQLYAWIKLIYGDTQYSLDINCPEILYILLGAYNEIDCSSLIKLSTEPWVYCRDKKTYKLLTRLGINAKKISNSLNCKEVSPKQDYQLITTRLGFPDPTNLIKLNNTLVISDTGIAENNCDNASISILPNPNNISINSFQEAQAISLWFYECYLVGIQLVWITSDQVDLRTQFWKAFPDDKSAHIIRYIPQIFIYPISSKELAEEIQWRIKGFKKNEVINPTDFSTYNVLDINGRKTAKVSVCISLYNYQDRIVEALESVKLQTLQDIDLIVVDDSSKDQSLQIAMDWINQNLSRFNQIKVIGHVHNQGLSAARNTAIKNAITEWVFILDADNIILPLALESTLKLTTHNNGKIAAVYTIIKVEMEKAQGISNENELMNFTYWDCSKFTERNIIDAMALIKRNAWEEVNGYDNIVGGWEDYDFWCKLMECGYSGIICPQILATYNIHENSMINTMTSKKSRQVSRQLQECHPWLNLPMANEHIVMLGDE